MIKLIIWSKDRAAQLDLLLRSIALNLDWFNTTVIVKYSSEQFARGYDIIHEEHPHVSLVQEQDFCYDTMTQITYKMEEQEHLCFSTDDTCIYRKPKQEYSEVLPKLPTSISSCFSLRLGLNTIVQNPHTADLQPALRWYDHDNGIISWSPREYHPLHNYGYPFGLDMHIYHRKSMLELMSQIEWSNSNQLESRLFDYRQMVNNISAFQYSVAVNIPMNTMSKVTRAGEKFGYSPEWLNDNFLDGKRISLDSVQQDKVRGAHQEMEIKLV